MLNGDRHRRLYKDYRKAETPLIRQTFPISQPWILLNCGYDVSCA